MWPHAQSTMAEAVRDTCVDIVAGACDGAIADRGAGCPRNLAALDCPPTKVVGQLG
jgi:hypothetical protein